MPIHRTHLNCILLEKLLFLISMMCGIKPNELCNWSEALPGQFGFTKQLVFRIALPHITLLLISVGYAIFGCLVLSAFDFNGVTFGNDENRWENKTKMLAAKLESIKNLYAMSFINGTEIHDKTAFNDAFNKFVTNLFHIYEKQQYLDERPPNFMWNLFFSTTWLTSIGYGENAPRTTARRVFCMIYLIFGIPLYLVTLADLAKFCTEAINRFYTECIKLHYQLRHWYRRRSAINIRAENNEDIMLLKLREQHQRKQRRQISLSGKSEEEMAEFLWKHLEKTHFVEVPFALIYLLLIGYIIFAAYFVSYLENWSMWDAFYFIVMSVLTIGFGDIVPKNSNFILPILLVILLGLIVATTFIDIVGAYYIERIHFVGRRLDMDDPLLWLKSVQQRRIEAMKREAMRRLFETISAMWHFHVVPPPPPLLELTPPPTPNQQRLTEVLPPPRGIVVFNVTADSATLKWEPPLQILLDGRKFWYTLSWKPRTPQRMCTMKVVDFVRQSRYVVTGLRTFTLYEFSVRISTKTGTSRPARCQEYTEPCTVPQLLQLCAISSESATISWSSPRKNLGTEKYFILFAQEPAPQFQYWQRYEVGKSKRFTLTELNPDTRYVACVFATHNFGFAAMSRSLRFKTRSWWYQEEEPVATNADSNEKGNFFLAPPSFAKWMFPKARRPSLREPSIYEGTSTGGTNIGGPITSERKSSLQSGEYQDRS